MWKNQMHWRKLDDLSESDECSGKTWMVHDRYLTTCANIDYRTDACGVFEVEGNNHSLKGSEGLSA